MTSAILISKVQPCPTSSIEGWGEKRGGGGRRRGGEGGEGERGEEEEEEEEKEERGRGGRVVKWSSTSMYSS